MPCRCRPEVVGKLDIIGVKVRRLQPRVRWAREIQGIGEGAIVNMNHGIKTE